MAYAMKRPRYSTIASSELCISGVIGYQCGSKAKATAASVAGSAANASKPDCSSRVYGSKKALNLTIP